MFPQSELQRKTLQNFNNRSNKSLNQSPVTTISGPHNYGATINEESGKQRSGGGIKKQNSINSTDDHQIINLKNSRRTQDGSGGVLMQRHEYN